MNKFKIKLFFILLIVSATVLSQSNQPASLSQKTIYKIGVSDNPPISFINDKNEVDGLIFDLLNQMALKENFEIQWVYDEWNILLDKTKKGELDMLTAVGFSVERSTYFNYSKENFANSWSNIYIPKFSTIEGFLDLDKRKIAMIKDDINGKNLKVRCEKFEIDCQIIEITTYTKLFEKVSNNEVDAVVSNNIAGSWYANKYKLINSSIIFGPSLTYVATPKVHSTILLDLYDKYIRQWKTNPESIYFEIKTKWLTTQSKPNLSNEIIYSIVGLTLFGLLAFLTAMVFKYQIKKRVNELSIRNEQFSQIINLVPHMIYVAEDNGNIVLANKKASQYFGMTSEEIDRCKIDNLKPPNSKGISFLNDNNLSKNIHGAKPQETEVVDYLDNEYSLLISKMPFKITNDIQMANVTVAVDITYIKKYEQQIMHMAHYNLLTNLPNKVLFREQIQQSIKEHYINKKIGAVMHLDLDSFKDINDSQGHMIGDLLLQSVARRFESVMDGDKTLSHFGGDEFIINIPNLSEDVDAAEEMAVEFSEYILDEIAKPYTIEGRSFQITASIGVVLYPHDGKTVELLMQRADTALNKAKQKGRNCLQILDGQLELSAIINHKLETDLRLAVENAQFNIVYQPLVKGVEGDIVGAEALLRWEHPTKGQINTSQFIEMAEKIHLIVKIGYWVFEKVCQLIRKNIDAGYGEFFIAVNVSVVQLKDISFHDNIAYFIKKYKIPPNHLEIEITESVLMDDVDLAIKIFDKLKLLGIRISIDDFGTGYSSFSYLIKLPIDKIKIDMSFVTNLPLDISSATIVRTIIKMAKELNIIVLAEGVENKQQLEFLDSEGCEYFQGYLFHKPMDYAKLLELKSKSLS
jgi:diguanylate cyclase (GGDEF)-like protein/PAS domain S-box-containing protein